MTMSDCRRKAAFVQSVRDFGAQFSLDDPQVMRGSLLDSFHLSRCGSCGQPSFQQPCPTCGYYPYASRRETIATPPTKAAVQAGRARWVGAVRGKGGIAAWALERGAKQSVAYRGINRTPPNFAYVKMVDTAIAQARRTVKAFPTPEEVWDMVMSCSRADERKMNDARI